MDGKAFFGCLWGFFVIGVIVAGLILIPQGIANMNDAQASRVREQQYLEQVRADREHQRSVDWQHEFMVWTAWLQVNKPDCLLTVGAASLAVIAFVLVARWFKEIEL